MRLWGLCALAFVAGCNALLDIDHVEFGDVAGAGGSSTAGSGGATGGTGGVGGTGGSGAVGAWYDAGFGWRQQLTIDNSAGEPLADFPLLVVLDETRIDYAKVQSSGSDLRFVDDDDATLLDYEIEHWQPGGTSYVWVEVPDIPADSTTRFVWMYFGNPVAADAQDPAGTWSNGYTAVWHMGGVLRDSTESGHDGTNIGTLLAAGAVSTARTFDGAASYVEIGQTVGLENLFATGGTVCAWLRPSSYGGGDRGRLIDKTSDITFDNGWGLVADGSGANGALSFGRGFVTSYGLWAAPPGSLVLGGWQHVAVTYDDGAGTDPAIYLDGVPQVVVPVSAPAGEPQADDASALRIGATATATTRTFDGEIDEVRLAAVARPAGWLAAQYRSMTDAMVSVGAEEVRP